MKLMRCSLSELHFPKVDVLVQDLMPGSVNNKVDNTVMALVSTVVMAKNQMISSKIEPEIKEEQKIPEEEMPMIRSITLITQSI